MIFDLNYCPRCASPLAELLLETEDRPRHVCLNCGYVFYLNPKVVSGTLPVDGGKVWLLRRGIEPRLGFWTHPAGFQELDESTEDAAIRETREELGCVVELTGLLGIYSRPHAPVNIVYLARLSESGGCPTTTPEAIEVQAFTPGSLPWDDLAFPSTHSILRDWLRRHHAE